MKRNFYEILNLDERLLPYFLEDNQGNEDIENISKYRDEKIRSAYEEQRKKLEQEYNEKLKKIESERDFNIGVKKLLIRMRNVAKKVIEANKKGIEKEERDFNATVIELNGEYELKFQELDFAYENIKTEELRQKYNQTLQSQSEVKSHAEYIKQITDEIESEIKTKQIEKRYSKVGNYDPELIKTISDGISKGEKLVLRKSSKDPVTISLKDERNTTIKQTGRVLFANFMECESYVNEYQIVRYVDNQQKVDTVYTILDLPKLGFNKNTGRPLNPQYYNCVTNKLLSGDAIEGSKHNGGYIGLVEKDDYGYDITIDKKLSKEEEENLTAVMILKEREEKRKNISGQRKGDDR